MVKMWKNQRFWLIFGAQWTAFSLGINIGKYGIGLDLGFVWVSVEF